MTLFIVLTFPVTIFLHKHRNDCSGGGVALYLADYLNFKLREDLGLYNKGAESMFMESIEQGI